MTAQTVTVGELLKKGEGEFDQAIKEMTMKTLMETISNLQKEMSKEQESFNSLSSELQNRKERNSRQYKQISKDLVASQQRLTQLMNWSMKCFAQQNLIQTKDPSPLKRRNSVKGPHPAINTSVKSTIIQRSRSLHSVNQPDESPTPSPPQPQPTAAAGELDRAAPHKPIIMQATFKSISAKPNPIQSNTTNSNTSTTSNKSNQVNSESVLRHFGLGTTVQGDKPTGDNSNPLSAVSTRETTVNRELTSSGGGGGGGGGSQQVGVDGTSGGLYVKRKPGHQTRVTTTTNVSSSSLLPMLQHSVGSSVAASSSPSSHSPSLASPSFSQHTPSVGPAEPHVVTAKPLVQISANSTVPNPKPLEGASRGLSKSQMIAADPLPQREFRGLPNVKLLAKTFGSSTALNTSPDLNTGPRLGASRTVLFSSRPLVRSHSSVSIADSSKHTSSNIVHLTKGNTTAVGPDKPPEPTVIVNGMSQRQLVNRYTEPTSRQSTAKIQVSNSGPSELELARARLKTSRTIRETTTNRLADNKTSADSLVVSLATSRPPTETVGKAPSGDHAKVEKSVEDSRPVSYVKKKDLAPGQPGLPPSTAPVAVTLTTNTNSKVGSNSVTAGSVTQNNDSRRWLSSSNRFNSSSSSSSSSSAKPEKATPAAHTSTPQYNAEVPIGDRYTTKTLPTQGSTRNERVISTATLNMRRSKSREELQDTGGPLFGKESLLQQIQARRRDDYDSGGVRGSNFVSMSKLSLSMPSLLDDGNDGRDGSRDFPIKSSIVLPPKVSGVLQGNSEEDISNLEEQEKISRMNLRNWDPSPVVSELYKIKLMEEIVEDISHQFITMEGLMEKLPINKKKATLLKTWKRRFFRAKDGWLYYYESGNRDEPTEAIQLMGGMIHDMGNRVLGVDDGRGRYLMVRCPTEKEYGQWKISLESQTADNTKATYVKPVLKSSTSPNKKVIILDLGSSAIRAGVLGVQASLPDLFIPSVLAVDKETDQVVAIGIEALKPEIRSRCRIVYPIRPSNKVDQFNIELQYMGAIFSKLFQDLNISPADYWLMISTPQNLGDSLKKGIMECLMDKFNVRGVCMVQQALLSLYSYKAASGIILDIGQRIEVLPIFEGFVIEGGVARCPFGGQKVQESLTTSLLGCNYKFSSSTEQWLVRYIMEQSCYVAIDYQEEEEWCRTQPDSVKSTINLAKFNLPEGAYKSVEHSLSRFKSPEGFFNVDMWELDYPTLHKLIHQAIQSCPMDNRRHMWRAVFLSGGVTMLPGFPDRLERELTKLAPPGVPVEVHAAPQRYHCAYIGAAAVALMSQFEEMAISRDEWKKDGVRAFRKWQAPAS